MLLEKNAKAKFLSLLPKGVSRFDKRTVRGLRSQSLRSGGPESFVMLLPSWAAEKAFGKKKVKKLMWDKLSKPSLSADIMAGDVLGKIPGAKGLFTHVEKVPWGKGMTKDVARPSALAPVIKARDIATPFIVGVGLERGLKKLREKREGAPQTSRPENASA